MNEVISCAYKGMYASILVYSLSAIAITSYTLTAIWLTKRELINNLAIPVLSEIPISSQQGPTSPEVDFSTQAAEP